VKQQAETDTINKAEENKTSQDEIFDTLKQLFEVEAVLKTDIRLGSELGLYLNLHEMPVGMDAAEHSTLR